MVYIIQDSSNRTTQRAKTLETRSSAHHLLLQNKELDRKSLFQKLQAANESFLFIDYDIWVHRAFISIVQEPPCLSNEGSACISELDTAMDIRVTDQFLLGEYASQIFKLAHIFHPSHESLIFLIEQNTDGKDIEEAACEWIKKNNDTFYKDWVMNYEAHKKNHEIAVFLNPSESSKDAYRKVLELLQLKVNRLTGSNVNIILRRYDYKNHFDKNYIRGELLYYLNHGIRQRLIGAVVGGNSEMTAEAIAFDKIGVPVLFYDVNTADVDSSASVWLTSGRSFQLALAMTHFIHKHNWVRIAVLSDSTDIAKKFMEELLACTTDLRKANKVVFRDHILPQVTSTEVKRVLGELQYENARIIVVNTKSQDAATILKAAVEFDMNNEKEFVWIVREWVGYEKILNIKYFTISFCCPKENEVVISSDETKLTKGMNILWRDRKWPRSAVALIDAVLIMAKGFEDVVLKYPQAREDPHSIKAIR